MNDNSSNSNEQSLSRREFFITTGKTAAGIALGVSALSTVGCGKGDDDNGKKFKLIDLNEPSAKNIGYVHDIKKGDTKNPNWKINNTCNKCAQYVEIKNAKGGVVKKYGRCNVIPVTKNPNGPVVSSKGWCTVYTPKAPA